MEELTWIGGTVDEAYATRCTVSRLGVSHNLTSYSELCRYGFFLAAQVCCQRVSTEQVHCGGIDNTECSTSPTAHAHCCHQRMRLLQEFHTPSSSFVI